MGKAHMVAIDLPALMYRSCLSPGRRLTSPTGEPTTGVSRLLQTMLPMIDKLKPDYLVMADDGHRSDLWRRKIYPPYKAKRDDLEPDPDLFPQIKKIRQLVADMGMPVVLIPDQEADDIVATLAHLCAGPNCRVTIVGSDKDLHQLVTDDVQIYDPVKDVTIDRHFVKLKWGVDDPARVADYQAIMGDGTDGVPGCAGIGEKGARSLMDRFGDIWGVLEGGEDLKPGELKKLASWDFEMMLNLVTLRRDCTIDLTPEQMQYDGYDLKAIQTDLLNLGFTQWV